MLSLLEHKSPLTVVRGYESSIDNTLTGIGFGSSAIINTVEEPEALYIVSSSANDTDGGTGAHIIDMTLNIIESGSGEVTQVLMEAILNGTSDVYIDWAANSISSMSIQSSGSGNTNAGVISIKTVDTDTVLYTIPVGTGTSQSSLHTAAGSRPTRVKQLNVYTDATTTSNVPELYEIIVRTTSEKDSGDFSSTTSGLILATFFATPGQNEFEMYDSLSPGDKIWVTAKNVTNSNSNAVSTELIMYGV